MEILDKTNINLVKECSLETLDNLKENDIVYLDVLEVSSLTGVTHSILFYIKEVTKDFVIGNRIEKIHSDNEVSLNNSEFRYISDRKIAINREDIKDIKPSFETPTTRMLEFSLQQLRRIVGYTSTKEEVLDVIINEKKDLIKDIYDLQDKIKEVL